jgi:hypothetical protein
VTLQDGRRLDVISVTKVYSAQVGRGTSEHQLVIAYWSDQTDPEQMRIEARGLATTFYPLADANHLDVIVMKPSRPLLSRSLLLTRSVNLRFLKDATGLWRED